MGYIGPCVVERMKSTFPEATLVGFDMGYFANCLTNARRLPESRVDVQYFGDVRNLPDGLLEDVDIVVHLAAISNDPMGKQFEDVTLDINYRASVALAKKAKQSGVAAFVFASSCSIYGSADDEPRTESSSLNPLTAYAKSKVQTEIDLKPLADDHFKITCLRFATACGMSERLRLDLVLNDFVACAVASKNITILSDGTPWRPLINIQDMARAIEWAIIRNGSGEQQFLVVNVGSEQWNYQVKDLAEAVAEVLPDVSISINDKAQPDNRSYKVNFDLYRQLASGYQPKSDLVSSIQELKRGLEAMQFSNPHFRDSEYIRLNVLNDLKERGYITSSLKWSDNS